MEEGHTAHRRASTCGLAAGRTTITVCLSLRKGVPSAWGRVGDPWQERESEKGVAWLGHMVYLSRH